jgi:superfamily I DNA and/or RNA helicase
LRNTRKFSLEEPAIESLLGLMVSRTVDSFQRREKDVIIYS